MKTIKRSVTTVLFLTMIALTLSCKDANKKKCLASNVSSRIKTGQYDKVNCGCGSIINKCEVRRHEQSKKHQKYLLDM